MQMLRISQRTPAWTGENDYRITVAAAGFGENELSIKVKENTLRIRGEKQQKADKQKGEAAKGNFFPFPTAAGGCFMGHTTSMTD